jgi:hypothetical protein
MTPEYILRKSLCRPASCADGATVEARARQIEYMNFAEGYAEPGYAPPRKAVLFADWNYFCRDVVDLLERYGFDTQWEDEWSACEGCNKAARTQPNSYGWQPSYAIVGDCGLYCADCIAGCESTAREYLEELENHPRKALNLPAIDPADYGYVLVEGDFENGWYPGQNDDPTEIYNRLKSSHPRLLFQIDGVRQFDLGFSVWSHPEEKSITRTRLSPLVRMEEFAAELSLYR